MPRKVLVSRHAEEQMAGRQIPREWLESLIENPEQRMAWSRTSDRNLRTLFASRVPRLNFAT